MFFVLSKAAGFFAVPSNFLVLLGLAGVVLLRTRFHTAARRLLVASIVLIAVAGFSPLGNWLIFPLEQRFPPWDAARGAPDGIIVLGGAIGPEISAARGAPQINESAERITAVAALARRYPAARIVYSGGNGNLLRRGAAETDFALPLFESFGIARARITLEGRSRNTVENAVFSKEVVAPKAGERWLLVTSAYHMPRAIGVFRKAGFAVEAYPVDWRTEGTDHFIHPFATLAAGLARTDVAMHEWIGLVTYWATGKTPALFPGPNGG
jgi:uncharacterized SAM-binding protein YcdF (DUF218 family)